MKFRELKTESELEIYRHAIAEHIDVLLPVEYLKQGHVFGYYHDNGEICGGFAMITEGPFRVLDSIPNFKELKIDPQLSKTAEITGVWLSNKNKKSCASLRFWVTIMFKILASRKKYFVYAYSQHKNGLRNIYSKAKPDVLFRGNTKILPGMPAPDNESVEVVFRSRIIKQALKNPGFFIKRLIKTNKKQNKMKDHYETNEAPLLSLTSSLVELWP
jgi:hypothetical protein